MKEEITAKQLRNYLYILKKLENEQNWVFAKANKKFMEKYSKFKKEIIFCYIEESGRVDY